MKTFQIVKTTANQQVVYETNKAGKRLQHKFDREAKHLQIGELVEMIERDTSKIIVEKTPKGLFQVNSAVDRRVYQPGR